MANKNKSGRVISFIFAFIILAAGVIATIDRIDFVKNSVVTDGKVTDIIKKTSSKTDRKLIRTTKTSEISVVSYTDTKGQVYKIQETPFLSKAPFAKGSIVKIRYDKRSPSEGIVNSFVNLYGYIVMFYAIGIIFLLTFIYLNNEIRKQKKR